VNTTAVLAADRRNMGIKEEKGRRKAPGAFVVGDESEETTALSPPQWWAWVWLGRENTEQKFKHPTHADELIHSESRRSVHAFVVASSHDLRYS
jgi:hypothetical protein